MTYKIILYAIVLNFSLKNLKTCHNKNGHRITITGIAENDKDAAIVLTDKSLYILDGLDVWDKKYWHKKVTVTGKLSIEQHEKQSTDSIAVQERIGTWRIIKHPKWKLAE